MEEEDWFQATGPAAVGFNTHGTNIDLGGSFSGSQAGAECRGETGLVGSGGVVGVAASGSHAGVVGRGVDGGRGGKFEAPALTAQVQLVPDQVSGSGRDVEAEPRELSDPELPRAGTRGDLYMAAGFDAKVPAALWLCVTSDQDGRGAQWCQVLLGNMVEGQAPKR